MMKMLKMVLRVSRYWIRLTALLTIFGLSLTDCTAAETELGVENFSLYYMLGGGRATDSAASPRGYLSSLKGPRSARGSACSSFSRSPDVLDILSTHLEDSLTALSAVPRNISMGLPGSILCRAKPGTCQLLQHYVVRAENRWNLSVDECRQDFDAAGRADTPRQDLLAAARTEIWEAEVARGTSAAAAKLKVDASDGCVTWLGSQKAGCQGASPIWLLRDTARAGWCLLLGQPGNCQMATTVADSAGSVPLRRVWPTPDAAGDWVVRVLGDYRIQAGEAVETIPGAGLLPQIDESTEQLTVAISARVHATDLQGMATELVFEGAGVVLTAAVINALRDLPDRNFLIRRLANEAALADTLEQAFLARRLLLSGMMEPHIQRGGGVAETVARQIIVLEREIDRANWELQARRRAVSGSVLEVLAAHRALATPTPSRRRTPPRRLQ